MKQILLTKNKVTIIDDEDFNWLNQWKWFFNSGYARRMKYLGGGAKNIKLKTIHMSREIMKKHNLLNEHLQVDHINRNKLDNRKCNLRMVTCSQNQQNVGLRKDNKSGYKGIYWREKYKRWACQKMTNGKTIFLGHFMNIIDAIKKYKGVQIL
jgi:hypothetical protein